MNVFDRRELKATAEDALSCATNAKRLVLIWAAVSAVLPLLVSIMNSILDSQIAGTGGLSGIGLRSALSTIQSGSHSLVSLLMPFWNLGYIAAVMRFARKEQADHKVLFAGFRRFGPALRMYLQIIILLVILCIVCFNVGVTLVSLTPLADPVWAIWEQSQEMFLSGVMDEALLAATAEAMMPTFFICCGLTLIVAVPVFYPLRLADYCVLDSNHSSGLLALLESRRLMRHNCFRLFRLDLSFWWFYLAQLLLPVICYGDVILAALGIPLPFGEEAAFFIFYIAALLGQFALLYCCSNRVQTTYAVFYDSLRTPENGDSGLII